ncbi:hypothetical protein DFH27DRAFT_235377 [Peziza echinospora]|nr:hypothetical protein DFH27DRAFT_235377 [Peziza echinospora]
MQSHAAIQLERTAVTPHLRWISRWDYQGGRHPVRKFDFTELNGKEKWTAYKFTKNIYDIWMLTHLKRLRGLKGEHSESQERGFGL